MYNHIEESTNGYFISNPVLLETEQHQALAELARQEGAVFLRYYAGLSRSI